MPVTRGAVGTKGFASARAIAAGIFCFGQTPTRPAPRRDGEEQDEWGCVRSRDSVRRALEARSLPDVVSLLQLPEREADFSKTQARLQDWERKQDQLGGGVEKHRARERVLFQPVAVGGGGLSEAPEEPDARAELEAFALKELRNKDPIFAGAAVDALDLRVFESMGAQEGEARREDDQIISVGRSGDVQLVLDVAAARFEAGTEVYLYEPNGTDAQRFCWKASATETKVGGAIVWTGVLSPCAAPHLALGLDASERLVLVDAADPTLVLQFLHPGLNGACGLYRLWFLDSGGDRVRALTTRGPQERDRLCVWSVSGVMEQLVYSDLSGRRADCCAQALPVWELDVVGGQVGFRTNGFQLLPEVEVVLDVAANQHEENVEVRLWGRNGTAAQDFLRVDAAGTGEEEEGLDLAGRGGGGFHLASRLNPALVVGVRSAVCGELCLVRRDDAKRRLVFRVWEGDEHEKRRKPEREKTEGKKPESEKDTRQHNIHPPQHQPHQVFRSLVLTKKRAPTSCPQPASRVRQPAQLQNPPRVRIPEQRAVKRAARLRYRNRQRVRSQLSALPGTVQAGLVGATCGGALGLTCALAGEIRLAVSEQRKMDPTRTPHEIVRSVGTTTIVAAGCAGAFAVTENLIAQALVLGGCASAVPAVGPLLVGTLSLVSSAALALSDYARFGKIQRSTQRAIVSGIVWGGIGVAAACTGPVGVGIAAVLGVLDALFNWSGKLAELVVPESEEEKLKRELGKAYDRVVEESYGLLHSSADTTDEELRSRYRKLVLDTHPDKPWGNKKDFQAVQTAWIWVQKHRASVKRSSRSCWGSSGVRSALRILDLVRGGPAGGEEKEVFLSLPDVVDMQDQADALMGSEKSTSVGDGWEWSEGTSDSEEGSGPEDKESGESLGVGIGGKNEAHPQQR